MQFKVRIFFDLRAGQDTTLVITILYSIWSILTLLHIMSGYNIDCIDYITGIGNTISTARTPHCAYSYTQFIVEITNNFIGPCAVIVQATGHPSTILCTVLSSFTLSVSAANLPMTAACSAVTTTQPPSTSSNSTMRLQDILA